MFRVASLLVPIVATLAGCDVFEPDCDGYDPSAGDDVALSLTELGYGDFAGDTGWTEGRGPVVGDATTWAELTAAWTTDGGFHPDFEREAVFVNSWADGGCGEWYEYTAWRWDDVLRVRASHETKGPQCDGYFPQVDLLLLTLAGATDLGWCE